LEAKDHVSRRCASRDQRQCDHEKWNWFADANQCIHCFFFPSPSELIFEIAGPEEAKNLAVLRLIQIHFTDAKAAGNSTCLSIQLASNSSTHQAKNFPSD